MEEVYPVFTEDFTNIALCWGIGRLAEVGLKAAFRKNYVESILAQSDFRLSAEAKATAGKINKQLQNP